MKINKITAETALVASFFALDVLLGLGLSRIAPFHVDEAHKIGETYYYDLFFAGRDVSSADWSGDFYARMNPPAAKYITGAWLASRGWAVKDLSLQREFERSWKDPAALRRQLPPGLLSSARAVSVFFGALTLLAVYLTGRFSGNALGGALGALLLACHPLFFYHASVALTDPILLFFMTAIVPAAAFAMRAATAPAGGPSGTAARAGLAGLSLAAGLLIAGAAGTKLNGALSAVFFALAMLAGLLISRSVFKDMPFLPSAVKASAVTALALCAAAALFIAMNPYLYTAPIHKLSAILRTYGDWMLKQALEPGPPLWTGAQKLAALGAYIFSLPAPLLSAWGFPLLFAAFFAGLACLAVQTREDLAGRRLPAWQLAVFAWLLVYGAGICAWLPVAWPRYSLPLVPPIALISGCGLACLLKFLFLAGGTKKKLRSQKDTLYRRAAAGAAVLAASLAVWYGGVARPPLPPAMLMTDGAGPAALLSRYEAALDRKPDDPLRTAYLADVRLAVGDADGAEALYRRAADMFAARPQGAEERVMTAQAELALARILLRGTRYGEAAAALKAHIEALVSVKSSLRSGDPKVLAEFDRLINESKELLAALPAERPSGKRRKS